MVDEEPSRYPEEAGSAIQPSGFSEDWESTDTESTRDRSGVMSSNLALSVGISKGVGGVSQLPSPSQSQAPSLIVGGGDPQRRNGSSFGAGATSRATGSPVNRNSQSLRKQQKGQRRPKLMDDDTVAESAAVRSSSSRKGQTSITHLMNITLPPRVQYQNHSFGRYTKRNPTWGLGSGYHATDKARYVHANYRFIVDPRGDYRIQAVDADVHLDWNNVLQILASAQSQSTNCPICLSIPVAPRMAKCGHIFCLPCLIRYMHSDDTTPMPEKKARSKKCPICWDSVYISETRPVRWFTGQEQEAPREGADVVLRLIMRQVGSTLALPRDGAEALSNTEDIPWYFAAEVTDFARVMKGSEDYMVTHFDREIEELKLQEKEDELMFGEETRWTTKAVSTIMEAKEKIKGIGNPPITPKKPEEKKIKRPPIKFNEDVPEFYSIQQAAKSGQSIGRGFERHEPQEIQPSDASVPLTIPPGSASSQPTSSPHVLQSFRNQSKTDHVHSHVNDSSFFFYQALLHYYLSPLDIRILKAAFGDYSSFPSTILPRVERVSTGHIVDDDLRKRAKYLAHLPHGCEVGFLECNWTDVVVPEVLETFRSEIERRRKRNREKEVREEKERLRAEKEEDDKRWAAARRKRPSVSKDKMPAEDLESLRLSDPATLSAVDLSAPSSSPPWLSSQPRTGSAFASLASPSTSPAAPRTVWGTTIIAPVSPILQATPHEPDTHENDGWLQGWERDLLHEEELVAQVKASSLGEGTSQAGSQAGKGKKKNKRITLMTTNGRRGL